MIYKEALCDAMKLLSKENKVLFVGQSVKFGGTAIGKTLKGVPLEKRIEVPVMEDVQAGMCIGFSLKGYIPICIYPRFDFMMLATNQIVNHLDKLEEISSSNFKPKIIIRTGVGSKYPINPGPQHSQNHVEAYKIMLKNIDVIELKNAKEIVPMYEGALHSDRSSILVEFYELYNKEF